MRPERWQQVKAVFYSALALPTDQRDGFLAVTCQGDDSLRREVEALIHSHEQTGSFIDSPAYKVAAQMLAGNKEELDAGQSLGAYKIISVLGAGGMGKVYLAHDTRLNRKVALKVLPPDLIDSHERITRFEQEAQAASSINHPNIITIHEIGAEGDLHFIAMEFIEGETLRSRLQTRPIEIGETLNIGTQIAAALDVAHRNGIVHRDIKPENVMLRDDGLVKVLDFGLAKLTQTKDHFPVDTEASTRAQARTTPGAVMGTVAYMSPEQVRGLEVDARTDIFTLGIVLYETLTGRLPFEGPTPSDIIASILTSEPAPLEEHIPLEMQRIIKRSLQKKVDERYQTTKDLLNDLKSLQRRLQLQAELGVHLSEGIGADHKTPFSEAKTKSGEHSPISTAQHANSIAVLPFTNMSNDDENEYFCDGLAEELLNALAKIEDLRVAARTSSFSFRGKNLEVSQIGKILNVKTILEGGVRRSGNRIRITVQLINAANGYHIWSERYEREMQDIFDLQDEITLAVVDALKVKLLGEEKAAVLKRGTKNTEAFELYLRGRFHYNKRTAEEIRKAIKLFGDAIQKDPTYALAYAAVAESYNTMTAYPYLSPKEASPQVKAAAMKALEIDPTLAEAHTALATYFATYEWNWTDAEREFKRAIELRPNNSSAHFRYGLQYLAATGRNDEAIAELQKVLELEPLSRIAGANLAAVYMFAGENKRALEQAKKTYELEPDFLTGRYFLGVSYNANGMYDQAIALSEEHLKTYPESQLFLRIVGYAYAKAERQREAEKVISKFREIAESCYVMSYWVATIYAALGDKEKAFAELEKAFAEHDWEFHRLKVDPFMESLRDDPRFTDLLRRVNLIP